MGKYRLDETHEVNLEVDYSGPKIYIEMIMFKQAFLNSGTWNSIIKTSSSLLLGSIKLSALDKNLLSFLFLSYFSSFF